MSEPLNSRERTALLGRLTAIAARHGLRLERRRRGTRPFYGARWVWDVREGRKRTASDMDTGELEAYLTGLDDEEAGR